MSEVTFVTNSLPTPPALLSRPKITCFQNFKHPYLSGKSLFVMKKIIFLSAFLLAGLASCTSQTEPTAPAKTAFQNLDVTQFRAKATGSNVVLLDVRTPEETAQGKIEGASELDFNSPNFAAEVEKLDKNKTYLVYCQAGGRSAKACQLMSDKGFKSIFNLSGGYSAWMQH